MILLNQQRGGRCLGVCKHGTVKGVASGEWESKREVFMTPASSLKIKKKVSFGL